MGFKQCPDCGSLVEDFIQMISKDEYIAGEVCSNSETCKFLKVTDFNLDFSKVESEGSHSSEQENVNVEVSECQVNL